MGRNQTPRDSEARSQDPARRQRDGRATSGSDQDASKELPDGIDINADVRVPALVLLLQQKMHQDTNSTMNALIDSFRWSYYQERARTHLVRNRIEQLYDSPWIPNADAVLRCLYPNEEDVKRLAKKLLKHDGVEMIIA